MNRNWHRAETVPENPLPFQFGLRWLLVAMTAAALWLAVWTWSREAALLGALALATLGLIVQACRAPTWGSIALALGSLVAAPLLALEMCTVAAWVGQSNLPVAMTVVHRTTGQPIADARVELRGPPWAMASHGKTNAAGQVTLHCDFLTTGRSGWFENSAFANAGEHRVTVSARGFLALDREFGEVGVRAWRYREEQLEIVLALAPAP